MSKRSFVGISTNESSQSELGRAQLLQADLAIPPDPKGLVLFCHGSGSGRLSPRNKSVAEALNKDGVGTLLVDLLTVEEEQVDIRAQKMKCKMPGLLLNKFNVKLLANRVISVTQWLSSNDDTKNLVLGYFGASTGTAAALMAAAIYIQYKKSKRAIITRSTRRTRTRRRRTSGTKVV